MFMISCHRKLTLSNTPMTLEFGNGIEFRPILGLLLIIIVTGTWSKFVVTYSTAISLILFSSPVNKISVLVNAIMCSIPIAQMIVGIIYWDQCPLSDKIPLYMVLTGVIWILAGVRIWAPNWVDQSKFDF